jgi:hypothetical protein
MISLHAAIGALALVTLVVTLHTQCGTQRTERHPLAAVTRLFAPRDKR